MIRSILAIALFAAALAHAQDGVIAGTVRDAVTKRPLPGAAVSIDGEGFQASAVSDGVGAFRFEGLAPASYRVRCRLADYDGSDVRGAFHLVDLKSRHVREGLNIDLIAFSSVEGTVFDEEGKPLGGVSVFARGAAHGSTDREGHFQMKDLAPADYRIELRVPLEIRRQTIKNDDDTGETFGYPNTEYYPGTADPQGALSVPISAGLQLHGVDVHLRRVRLVGLSGRVLEQVGGEPMTDARVELSPNFNSLPGETFAARAADRTGAFRFDLIQPGSFSLLIFRGASSKLPYVQPVEIGKAGIEGLTVRVPPFERIEGSVHASTDEAEWTGNLVISLMPMQRGAPSQTVSVTKRDFVLEELPPGRYALHVQSGASQKPEMRKLVVGAIRMGLQDLTASTMTVAEGGNPPLDIRLSAATGSLKVTVIDPQGAPRRLIFVRSERKGDAGGGTEAHPTGADGTVTVDDLAPGAYEVAVVVQSSLFTAAPKFTRIEVKAGETALVELRAPGR